MQPRFEGIDSVYKSKADNKDIRDLLERLVPKSKSQMADFSKQFKGRTEQDTCKKIFDYLKNNFTYVADGNEQIIKLPSALLKKKVGDCKSYSLFTSGILENLGIPYHFVYASYSSNPIPGHVYVTTNNGCIIDAVYGIFNQEKKPIYKYKKNMNVRYMAGLDCKDCNDSQLGKVKLKLPTIVSKDKRQDALNAAKRLKDQAEAAAKKARDAAQAAAKKAADAAKDAAKRAADAAKNIRDKAGQGAKTIALAPGRALFLLMIKKNLDGLASKLQSVNTTSFSSKWKDLGGDRTILAKAIKDGASKPAKKFGLLSKLKKITSNVQVNGIGQVVVPGSVKASIISATTAAGTAIGGAPQGTAAGASAGGIIVELLPTLLTVFKKTPDTTETGFIDPGTGLDPNAEGDGTTPSGDGTTPGGDGTTPGGGGTPAKMNMKVILPIAALVVGGGIYLATRKK